MNDKYYDEIKELLINNEITKKVKDYSKNRSDLETYYNVGKILSNAGKHYGEGIIKKYSVKLKREIDKKYSTTTLKYIRQFYYFSKSHSLSDQLTFTHYRLLFILSDDNEINYYIDVVKKTNCTVRKLEERIKLKEYERLSKSAKEKIIHNKEMNIQELILEPIVIKSNLKDREKASEKILHQLIVENIKDFMNQLGKGYSYIGDEYIIKIGDNYNYIDLLLFNYIYNCFIVIELKATELKKEHIGQIQVYMNYIDQNIKSVYHDKTIGIILVKKNNEFIIEYSSDSRIVSRKYEIV